MSAGVPEESLMPAAGQVQVVLDGPLATVMLRQAPVTMPIQPNIAKASAPFLPNAGRRSARPFFPLNQNCHHANRIHTAGL